MPQFGSSPVQNEPLLGNAQGPGMSQRLSESSIASYDTMSNPNGRMANSSSTHSFSSATPLGPGNQRFGPTASMHPSTPGREPRGVPGGIAAGAGAGGVSAMMDDDDLDDALHTFTAKDKKDLSSPFDITSGRGWANALMLATLAAAMITLFAAYPIISAFQSGQLGFGSNTPGYNLGGINSTGQYPDIGIPRLLDPETPQNVYTKRGYDGQTWNLVYSDEFNTPGRTFYPGDDPFWEAMDIHYWPTGDFEWLDPSAVTTKDGHLVITMTQEPINDLNFKSGMIQSWNKLCFNRNAHWEVSVSLPGTSSIGGFWPAFWTMGNLGRAGYGGTTDGLWPYSYDTCDIGTLPNQTYPNMTGPISTLTTGDNQGPLSFLPGQRYSACTCPGEDHPGPNNGVGRSAPEIDLIEAQIIIDLGIGEVSQSNQIAPYDAFYQYNNASIYCDIADLGISKFNSYKGGIYQEAVSVLTQVPSRIYRDQVVGGRRGEFAAFELEWYADFNNRKNGFITWAVDGKRAWTMRPGAIAANPLTEIGDRIVAEEPMYMIFNYHMSNNFQAVNFAQLTWPNEYRVDYIRVYQRGDGTMGCDPADRPTKDFINRHLNIYNNANISQFSQTGLTWPKNRLVDTC